MSYYNRNNKDIFYGSTIQAAQMLRTNRIDTASSSSKRIYIGGCANIIEILGDLIVTGNNYATGLRTNVSTINVNVSASNPPLTDQVLVATSPSTAVWEFAAGTGDVVGPASSTDNEIVRYDGTTGKLLKSDTTFPTTLDDNGVFYGPTIETTTLRTRLGYDTNNPGDTGANNTYIGINTGSVNTTGERNVFVGQNAGKTNDSGSNNVFVGFSSGLNNTIGSANTFVGYNTGLDNVNGASNTFIGSSSGQDGVSTQNNTFVGLNSGLNNTADNNTFIGLSAGLVNTVGTENTFVGLLAGGANTTGVDNVFIGDHAGASSTGNNNIYIGANSGSTLTTQSNNTHIGFSSGMNSTGQNSVLVGYNAGLSNTVDNRLVIENSNENAFPLVDGTFATNVGKTNGILKLNATLTIGNDATQKHTINGAVSATASAGANLPPPATVAGFLTVHVNGGDQKIPFYDV